MKMCESEVVCSWLDTTCLPKTLSHCPPQLNRRENITKGL